MTSSRMTQLALAIGRRGNTGSVGTCCRAPDTDFAINDSNEVATITGAMKIEIIRAADDGGARLRLRIRFPNDELFDTSGCWSSLVSGDGDGA